MNFINNLKTAEQNVDYIVNNIIPSTPIPIKTQKIQSETELITQDYRLFSTAIFCDYIIKTTENTTTDLKK